jgi:hypothetical protein
MNRQKKGHILKRIGQLILRQRAGAPVGKGMCLIQLRAMDSLDEVGIGNLRTEADHRGGNLRVEEWLWYLAGMDREEIQVLSSGMHNFLNRRVTHNLPEGIQRAACHHCGEIDDCRRSFRGDLNQFKLGHKAVFAHKFSVECQARTTI